MPSALVIGTKDDDRLFGTVLDDSLQGLFGNDRLTGGRGPDRLDGGEGFDIASYTTSSRGIVVDLFGGFGHSGDATGDRLISIEGIHGSQLEDEIDGDNADNTLYGMGGVDVINGHGGNDRISGGEGPDTLDGGDGIDTLIYGGSWRGVEINLSTGFAAFGDAKDDTISGFENIVGSSFADVLTGDAGTNRLFGKDGDDQLNGLDGNDFLFGGAGADAMDGGDGFDLVSYQLETSGISVNLGNGQMSGAATGDSLTSIEAIRGSQFADSIVMDGENNRIFGLNGADDIDAGAGNDLIIGGLGADQIDGGDGVDTVGYYGSASGVDISLLDGTGVGGQAQGDTFVFVENADGSRHNDILEGDDAGNRLRGRDGDDRLIGRGGADTLLGDAGADTFVFVDLADHVSRTQDDTEALHGYLGNTADSIRFFEQGVDMLEFAAAGFSGSIFNTDDIAALSLAGASDTAFAFAGNNLYYVGYADAGDFAAGVATVTHLARFNGISSLTTDDFVFA